MFCVKEKLKKKNKNEHCSTAHKNVLAASLPFSGSIVLLLLLLLDQAKSETIFSFFISK